MKKGEGQGFQVEEVDTSRTHTRIPAQICTFAATDQWGRTPEKNAEQTVLEMAF